MSSRPKKLNYVQALEEENIRLRHDVQQARADANAQYRKAVELEELLALARQEMELLRLGPVNYQRRRAQMNGVHQ